MKFVALAGTLVLFALLMFMAKKKMNFGTRTIVAAILGIIVGFIFKGNTEYVKVFGSIYANLLFAIVIPLLFTSIVSTVVSLESIEKMKKIGTKTIGILSLHNVLGSLIGLILGVAFKIGQGSSFYCIFCSFGISDFTIRRKRRRRKGKTIFKFYRLSCSSYF